MSRSLVLRTEAQAEFDDAFDWYERQRRGLGVEFLASVNQILERVAAAPSTYPIVRGDIRRALVHRFPYAVFYRAEPSQIVVLAILHGKRDPRVWQSRG